MSMLFKVSLEVTPLPSACYITYPKSLPDTRRKKAKREKREVAIMAVFADQDPVMSKMFYGQFN
jgi:hypothetical protein